LTWHANVTNGEREEDKLAALQWSSDAGREFQHNLGRWHRLRLITRARIEVWPRFEGLDVLAPGVVGTWEFKPGVGHYRPVFAAEVEGEGVAAWERERSGWGGSGRLLVRQRVGSAWLLTGGHEWARFDARDHAFDSTGNEWFGRVDWAPSDRWRFALDGWERVGTVISYSAPPRDDLEAIGKPITYVDTFEQAVPWIAYYFTARTQSVALEGSYMMGRAALTLRYEYRHTKHAGPGYKNHLTTLGYFMPF